MPLVYDELRRVARAQIGPGGGSTLQPTALVNEAYLRLAARPDLELGSREEFLRVTSRIMRNVLVDHVRARRSQKRGGDRQRVTLSAIDDHAPMTDVDILALDEALKELAVLNERKVHLVELRFFGGLTETEAAGALGISRTEATREWRLARAWLQHKLRDVGERS